MSPEFVKLYTDVFGGATGINVNFVDHNCSFVPVHVALSAIFSSFIPALDPSAAFLSELCALKD